MAGPDRREAARGERSGAGLHQCDALLRPMAGGAGRGAGTGDRGVALRPGARTAEESAEGCQHQAAHGRGAGVLRRRFWPRPRAGGGAGRVFCGGGRQAPQRGEIPGASHRVRSGVSLSCRSAEGAGDTAACQAADERGRRLGGHWRRADGHLSAGHAGRLEPIGRTPLRLFRPEDEPPVLLRAGDEVRFRPVTPEEFARLQERKS